MPDTVKKENVEYRYAAFISYRHEKPDRTLARWLHNQIEKYRTPKALVKRGISKRVGRVFRDEEELAASANLSREIETALSQSRFLIIICSPNTPESKWVNEEIVRFQSLDRQDQTLSLLIDGEPGDAFPSALRKVRHQNGALKTTKDVEPLAADVRPSEEESQRSIKKRAKLKIIATLLGVSYDDLRRREQERLRKRWTAVGIGLFALLMVISSLAVYAWHQRGVALEQRQAAIARQLIAQSELLRQQGGTHIERSMLLGIEAMKRLRRLGNVSLEADQAVRSAMELMPHHVTSLPHTSPVTGIAYDLNNCLTTASADGTIRKWDTTSNKEIGRLDSEGATPLIVVSNYGTRAAIASKNRPVQIWRADENKTLPLNEEGPTPEHMAFGSRASLLVTARGQTAHVWDTRTGRKLSEMSFVMPITELSLKADGSWLAAAGARPEVRVLDTKTGAVVAELVHEGMETVEGVTFNPRGSNILATVSMARIDMFHRHYRVSVWDVAEKRLIKSAQYDQIVGKIIFGPRNRVVALIVEDGSVRILSIKPGIKEHALSHEANVVAVTFSSTGHFLATADVNGTVRVWNARTGRELSRIANRNKVTAIAFSPDFGRQLAIGAGNEVHIYNAVAEQDWAKLPRRPRPLRAMDASSRHGRIAVGTGEVGYEGNAYVWQPHSGVFIARSVEYNHSVEIVRFSADGRWLMMGFHDPESCNSKIWIAEMDAVQEYGELRQQPLEGIIPSCVSSAAFSPDGELIAAAGYNDQVVRVWKRSSRQVIRQLIHTDPVYAIAFSPDARFIATGCHDGFVRLWVGDDVAIKLKHNAQVTSLAFSPGGQRLLSGGEDGVAVIWDVGAGREHGRVVHGGRVVNVSFSPDGDHVATASADGKARLWRSGSHQEIVEMIHGGSVTALVFSPDSRHLATASEDGTVRVWGVPQGVEVARIKHDDAVSAVRFSDDGSRLVSGGMDGFTRVSLWIPVDMMADACLRVRNNLSQTEWQRFMRDEPYMSTCPNRSSPMIEETDLLSKPEEVAEIDEAIRHRTLPMKIKIALHAKQIVPTVNMLNKIKSIEPAYDMPATSWNQLCWNGGKTGHAELVMPACERAVELAPQHGGIRDSRGLVRALTGDYEGAIEDFEYYLKWGEGKKKGWKLRNRQRWIQTLKDGKSPFDQTFLDIAR